MNKITETGTYSSKNDGTPCGIDVEVDEGIVVVVVVTISNNMLLVG